MVGILGTSSSFLQNQRPKALLRGSRTTKKAQLDLPIGVLESMSGEALLATTVKTPYQVMLPI